MLKWLLALSFYVILSPVSGQGPTYNFHLLDQGDGLNEGTIRCVGEDKYGYIWIGTTSGLNRYNGYDVTRFIHDALDSTTIMAAGINSVYCHDDGSLWIGGEEGLMEFDYQTGHFIQIDVRRQYIVTKIMKAPDGNVFVASSKGLRILDPKKKTLLRYIDIVPGQGDSLLKYYIRDMALWKDHLFLTTNLGLVDLKYKTGEAKKVYHPEFKQFRFNNIKIKPDGQVWLTTISQPHLLISDSSFTSVTYYDYIFPNKASNLANTITDLLLDRKGRIWLTTSQDGICYYDSIQHQFFRFINEPLRPGSPVVNILGKMFEDKNGLIWICTEGYGVNYFDPNQTLFQTFLPQTTQTSASAWIWARAMSEDQQHNLWMAMGEGVVKYDVSTKQFTDWKNIPGQPDQIHYNSVRGIVADDPVVWIITGKGVNRYHMDSHQMDFLTAKDGLPQGFYFLGVKDSEHRIWFCTRDHDGLYYYDPADKKITSIHEHPVLKAISGRGIRTIYEDHRHRFWIGMNGTGVAMYDPADSSLSQWSRLEFDTTTLAGDAIISIVEDHDGILWFSSNIGLTSYNPQKNIFKRYTQKDRFPNLKTCGLEVDHLNRLWIGTAQGLVMMDSSRQHLKLFDVHDGLPTYEFADMPATQLSDGRFAYPTLRGFVLFDPMAYVESSPILPYFISSFSVDHPDFKPVFNPEELTKVHLGYDQNNFKIQLASPYFQNPGNTWYAYQLDGFEHNWHYTQDRNIQYTNVPGGNYILRFKAATANTHWSEREKTLLIHINTVFYKTWWFWLLFVCSVFFLVVQYYRFRMDKQRQILELQSRATSLEKDKTQIQYENLKQQLNPHFLFNSLTSLRSLIRVDQKLATNFLDGLSKTYRYLLRSGDKELVTLEEELNFVETFIHLQQTRFGKGLQVNVEIYPNALHKMIAPVTLQNLLENAIKHNITSQDQPLMVHIFVEDDYLVVQNNLQRYRQVETSNKRGLASLHSLYRYLTSIPIEIHENEAFFTVKIPLI